MFLQQQQQQLFFLFLLMVWPESHLITYAHSSLTCPICIFQTAALLESHYVYHLFKKRRSLSFFFDKQIKSPFFKNSLEIF